MIARLVECNDHDINYGILTVDNVEADVVQAKIYEIKNRFYDEGFKAWTIDDVFEAFPDEWEWSYESVKDVVEI